MSTMANNHVDHLHAVVLEMFAKGLLLEIELKLFISTQKILEILLVLIVFGITVTGLAMSIVLLFISSTIIVPGALLLCLALMPFFGFISFAFGLLIAFLFVLEYSKAKKEARAQNDKNITDKVSGKVDRPHGKTSIETKTKSIEGTTIVVTPEENQKRLQILKKKIRTHSRFKIIIGLLLIGMILTQHVIGMRILNEKDPKEIKERIIEKTRMIFILVKKFLTINNEVDERKKPTNDPQPQVKSNGSFVNEKDPNATYGTNITPTPPVKVDLNNTNNYTERQGLNNGGTVSDQNINNKNGTMAFIVWSQEYLKRIIQDIGSKKTGMAVIGIVLSTALLFLGPLLISLDLMPFSTFKSFVIWLWIKFLLMLKILKKRIKQIVHAASSGYNYMRHNWSTKKDKDNGTKDGEKKDSGTTNDEIDTNSKKKCFSSPIIVKMTNVVHKASHILINLPSAIKRRLVTQKIEVEKDRSNQKGSPSIIKKTDSGQNDGKKKPTHSEQNDGKKKPTHSGQEGIWNGIVRLQAPEQGAMVVGNTLLKIKKITIEFESPHGTVSLVPNLEEMDVQNTQHKDMWNLTQTVPMSKEEDNFAPDTQADIQKNEHQWEFTFSMPKQEDIIGKNMQKDQNLETKDEGASAETTDTDTPENDEKDQDKTDNDGEETSASGDTPENKKQTQDGKTNSNMDEPFNNNNDEDLTSKITDDDDEKKKEEEGVGI